MTTRQKIIQHIVGEIYFWEPRYEKAPTLPEVHEHLESQIFPARLMTFLANRTEKQFESILNAIRKDVGEKIRLRIDNEEFKRWYSTSKITAATREMEATVEADLELLKKGPLFTSA